MAVNSGNLSRAFLSGSGERIASALRSVSQDASGVTARGDVSATVVGGTDKPTQVWNAPITVNRTVTLSTAGSTNGNKFRVVRTAAATGAFTLVAAGVTVAISAWADFEYDGTAWVNTAKGTLV